MKALLCRGPGQISYESVPDPELDDQTGAIVRTTLCAICGSDLHPYHVDLGRKPYCIGHEAVGEVVEIGRAVSSFAIGDRVLIPATLSCGRCPPCLSGQVVLCETFTTFRALGQGIAGVGGCQAEGVAVPAADHNLFKLPEALPDEVGLMLTDTLGTAWMACRRAGIAIGDTVAVIGLGVVGLQSVMCAAALGATRILAVDLLADRLAWARSLGAEAVSGHNTVGSVMEMTRGMGVDVVIDANGGPVTTRMAVEIVRRGGCVSNVGISEQADIPFPIRLATSKNVAYHTGICSAQAEVPALMKALTDGRLDPDTITGLFTHRMALSQGAEAYAAFNRRAPGMLKIALEP